MPRPRNAEELFDAVEAQRFGLFTCFLCGRRLGTRNRSDEHVIPKWLQQRHSLWDQELILLNGTAIPYRQLTIPCCKECNNNHLAPVEAAVQEATSAGPVAVRALDRFTLFAWLAKILYGLLYKEGFLLADRRSRKKTPIVLRPELQALRMLHYFLQGVRLPLSFDGFFPASIFVFDAQSPPGPEHQFDLRDLPPTQSIALRTGNVAIVACLMDGGAHDMQFRNHYARFEAIALHPLQFLELVALAFYRSSLYTRTPKYMIVGHDEHLRVIQMPLGGWSGQPLYADWSYEQYAQMLAHHIALPLERVFQAPTATASWLLDDTGDPTLLSFVDQPWPP